MLATREAVEALESAVLAAGPGGAVWAHLDDVCAQAAPAQAQACFEAAERALGTCGLSLNGDKTEAWSPSGAYEELSDFLR